MYGRRLGIVLTLLGVISARGATLAVNGAPGCSDTTGTPYCTINKAILAAANGDTIQIASGTYAGTIANFSKPLTFVGSGSGTSGTVITKSITYTGTGPLSFSNLRILGGGSNLKVGGAGNFSGLTLSGAAFIGNGTGAHGVFIKQNGSVSNVSVTNCTFNDHGQSGFLIQKGTGAVTNVDNVNVSGSTFAANGEYGFRTDPHTTNLHIANSNITNNAIDGFLLLNADGVTLENVMITGNRNGILLIPLAATDAISNVTLTNVTVNNNTRFISGQYGSGMALAGGTGPISHITAINSSFSGNTIHGVSAQGAVSEVSIQCSLVASNGQNGVLNASSPSAEVKAEYVYWGCATGPNTVGCSTTAGNVDFSPYRNSSTASCTTPVLTNIAVTPTSATLRVPQTTQLIATATYSDGSTADITATAVWSSANTNVATVSAGTVTAVSVGNTSVSATLGGFTASSSVTVERVVTQLSVAPATLALDPGQTSQLTATATYSDATTEDVTSAAVWTTSNASVATVDAGLVSAVGTGNATITVTFDGFTATTTVTVARVLTGLTISPEVASIEIGATTQLTATAAYSDGTTVDVTETAAWEANDVDVATVAAGLVTGVGDGIAFITANFESSTATARVNVGVVPVSIALSRDTITIEQDNYDYVSVIVEFSDGSSQDVTGAATWTSSDDEIAYPSSGYVYAGNLGTATITVAYAGFTATLNVTIVPRLLSLSIVPGGVALDAGQTSQLSLVGVYSDGSTTPVSGTITWSSSAEEVATVDSAGLVTAHSPGNATITGEAVDVGLDAHAVVTVLQPLVSISIAPSLAHLTVDATRPLMVMGTYADGASAELPTGVTWSSANTGIATVAVNGNVTAHAVGSTTIHATVGAFSASAALVAVAANPNPPNPALIAPPIDPTKITTVHESTRFLYEATPRVQTGVAPGIIERRRAAVIRGIVRQRGGAPLAGVRITINKHGEFGQTYTRADGRFDLAVNGGDELTVQYRKDGFIPSDRKVRTRWNDWSNAEDIVMITYDGAMTTVDLNDPGVKVHRGTISSDDDGTRRATLLFHPGTTATMTMADGTTQPIDTLSVRATEYTVGEEGPQAMPAGLPPQSAYTYAVELSADEAVAAGATQIDFSKPVSLYIEDFLDFGAGADVPNGIYDRLNACWVPSENGKTVQIVAIEAGRAYLDIDGDGVQNDTDTEIGTTIAEREKLATLYGLGATLWRVPIPHFSPSDPNQAGWTPVFDPGCLTVICDFSWTNQLEEIDVTDANSPQNVAPNEKSTPDTCAYPKNKGKGSLIECTNQVLGEQIHILGAGPIAYRTSRVPGRKTDRSVTIPLSKGEIPPSLKRIELEIECAGKKTKLTFPAQANLSHRFTWDGNDAYGRQVQGREPVNAKINYVYDGVYTLTRIEGQTVRFNTRFFGLMPVISRRLDRTIVRQTRIDVNRDQELQLNKRVGVWDARGAGLGGWTMLGQHVYDHSAETMQAGNGNRRDAQSMPPIIHHLAGNGLTVSTGDGQPAGESNVVAPRTVAVAADGTVYIGEIGRVRRVDAATGVITTFAGTGNTLYNGASGVPATQVNLNPSDISVANDGSLLIADDSNRRLFRVRNGLLTRVAGSGGLGSVGEGSSALLAPIVPHGVAAVGDCISYVADRVHNKIWRVMCDGRVYTVAGNGEYASPFDSLPNDSLAGEIALPRPSYVAVDSQGRVFFTTEGNAIFRVDGNGALSMIAPPDYTNDGYSSTISETGGLDVVGTTIYQAHPSRHQARRFMVGTQNAQDQVSMVGNGSANYSGDDGPAAQAELAAPQDVTFANGRLYIADTANDRVRWVEGLMPPTLTDELKLPSADGSEFYVFDLDGRHRRTVDALTGVITATFAYNAAGLLTSVTDPDGNATTIERGANGTPQAIVAPGGQRTTLQLDANGFISEIRNPAGEAQHFTYDSGGLMRTMTDPRSQQYQFDYDGEGRLILDRDPASGSTALSRSGSEAEYSVTRTTAEGRAASHAIVEGRDGTRQATITNFDGTVRNFFVNARGDRSISAPNGSATGSSRADTRFGFFAPLQSGHMSSQYRSAAMTESRSATVSDPDDAFSPPTTATRALTVNGRIFTKTWDAAARTLTSTTASGRTGTRTLDERGHLTRVELPGFAPLIYTYGGSGLLESSTQGSRTETYEYDARRRLVSVTDSLDRVVRLDYDDADRVILQTLPGNRQVAYDYDEAGNVTAITPTGRMPYQFSKTAVNLEHLYTPPSVPNGGATEFIYNRDRQLTSVERPGGTSIDYGYDSSGRLSSLTIGRGTLEYGYDSSTGNLASATTPEGVSLSYEYDGVLPRSVQYGFFGTGTANVTRETDNDFRTSYLSICAVSGCQGVPFEYDDDQLLTFAGAMTLTRDDENGLLTNASIGSISDFWEHNEFGETTRYESRFGADALLLEEYARDDGGRLVSKRVTIGGITNEYVYSYDLAGRLEHVVKDGAPAAHYDYDVNGNRLMRTTETSTETASCDGQDRMSSYAGTTYTYMPDGELESATSTAGTTQYVYDDFGNLLQVRLPDARVIDYEVDAQNRRVGRKVDGAVTQRWIYSSQLQIFAELDSLGYVVANFVYGTRANTPDYMVKGGTTFRIVTDNLGSPRLVVNIDDGSIAQRIDYDEFGRILSDTNPGFQPFGFAGGLYDRDTRLVRFGARDYDVFTGRWITKDPLLFGGGSGNLYAYVDNNPTNAVDPSGLISKEVQWWADLAVNGNIFQKAAGYVFGAAAAMVPDTIGLGADATVALPVPKESGLGLGLNGGVAAQTFINADPCGSSEGSGVYAFGGPVGSIPPAYAGIEGQFNMAWSPNENQGAKSWEGPFNQVTFGAGNWSAGVFWSPDGNWTGISIGYGKSSAAASASAGQTTYVRID